MRGVEFGVVVVLRKFVCALAAMIVMAPPLLACALPGVQMSAEEMACCRHMADQCGGDSSMPASHSCCKKPTSAQTGAFQIKQRDSLSLEMTAPVFIASVFVVPVVRVTASVNSILAFPESPPGHISVLRI
jgi:hypothetical protein